MPNGHVFSLASHLSAYRLVFVTCPHALSQMGWTQRQLETALGGQRLVVLSDTTGDVVDRADASTAEFLGLHLDASEIDGVVIISGYDGVAPRRIDPLPAALREEVEPLSVYDDGRTDSDNYYVWNDDHYVSFDGSGLPNKPVSRIPCWDDGGTSACQTFVKQQLEGTVPVPATTPMSVGARASEFGFGDSVYTKFLASSLGGAMWSAPPSATRTFADLQSTFLYLVLHGFENDGRVFRGVKRSNQSGHQVEGLCSTGARHESTRRYDLQ